VTVLVLVLGALVAAVGAVLYVVFVPASVGRAVDGFLVAHDLADDPDTRRAVARYVGRTRDFARRGMALGLLGAVVLGVAWYQQVTVGFGVSPIGDLVTMGLGGWFVGLLLSVRYWRTPAGDGPRVAPLTPRDVDRYRSPTLARSMAAVAALSGALGVAAVLSGDPDERAGVVVLALLTVAAMTWAARTQGRIARRPQPFVTVDLLAADDAMRVTSAEIVGLAAIGIGLVVVGWQAAFVAQGLAADQAPTWTWFLPAVPLVAGLVVAGRGRRRIHPRARRMRSPVAV